MTAPFEHPTHVQLGVGAIALEDGLVLLVKRGRPPYAGYWSLPGGKLLFGETIQEAIKRELLEETGLEAEVTGYAGMIESIDPEGVWHYVILDHFVRVTGGSLCASDDAAEARWVPLDEIASLQTTPLLLDALRSFGVID